MKRCRNCLISETYFNIKYDSKGYCSYCSKEQNVDQIEVLEKALESLKHRKACRRDFFKYINNVKASKNDTYECLLLYSGGKDSTYLLHLLVNKFRLKVLSLTIDNGLLNKIAKANIKRVTEKLQVDHEFITPEKVFFRNIYRFFLLNAGQDLYTDKICKICCDIIHGIGLREASKRNIPFIALGYSPDQTSHYFYEIPEKKILKNWTPRELKDGLLNETNNEYFWNPQNKNINIRFLLPFHVIGYPGERKIIEELSKLGLIKKREANPMNSNCHLIWLLFHLDILKSGYEPYIHGISYGIRTGKKNRMLWRIKLSIGFWLIKSGILKRQSIKKTLDYLDLKITDIL